MLNKSERLVMKIISSQCKNKSTVLITPTDIIRIIGDEKWNRARLDKTIVDLQMDGYFDLVYSDRQGEKVYCITLTEKGKGYERSLRVWRRNIYFRVLLSCLLAVISFSVGLLLKAIF